MGEVVVLDMLTSLDIPPERVLERAMESNLDRVMVIGVQEDGSLYFASSTADSAEMVYRLEEAKRIIFDESRN